MAIKSVYNKLDNLEPVLSAALVGTTAERMETIVTTMVAACPRCFRATESGFSTATISPPPSIASRSYARCAGALPGQALVVLDPSLMLVTDVILCEDGHAQERSLLD